MDIQSKKIASYNEFPVGLGFGKSIWDDQGNWQGLFGMVFLDSHKNVEPFLGYEKLYMHHFNEKLSAGLGWTFSISARPDVFNNIPCPILLPLAAFNYKNFMLTGAYVPGAKRNTGNIMFLYFKLTLS